MVAPDGRVTSWCVADVGFRYIVSVCCSATKSLRVAWRRPFVQPWSEPLSAVDKDKPSERPVHVRGVAGGLTSLVLKIGNVAQLRSKLFIFDLAHSEMILELRNASTQCFIFIDEAVLFLKEER